MSGHAPVLEGKGLVELLSKAVVDPGFQKELFANRAAFAKQYQLSLNDTLALEKINEVEFAHAAKGGGQNVSASWAIGVGVSGHFDAK
jgi:hypothetical protein